MNATIGRRFHRRSAVTAIAAALTLTACVDAAPVAPEASLARAAAHAAAPATATLNATLAELRRATARYHDVDAAIADGFVPVTECEVRPGEGQVGIVYVDFSRVADVVLDPSRPEALIYEPRKNGELRLVAVELAIPYALWTAPQPPEFFGAVFQPEDEFGVWGLHIWVWRHNPDGMFAEANPHVSCAE